MQKVAPCVSALSLKTTLKYLTLYKNTLRTGLKELLLLSTLSFALFTMLYCMTEMVIFALCDSSHFDADIRLVSSPQCMM